MALGIITYQIMEKRQKEKTDKASSCMRNGYRRPKQWPIGRDLKCSLDQAIKATVYIQSIKQTQSHNVLAISERKRQKNLPSSTDYDTRTGKATKKYHLLVLIAF